MDHIDETFTTQSRDRSLEPSLCAALSIAKETLNHYYNKTDHSEVYRIAMSKSWICFAMYSSPNSCPTVLHPRHKLKYFENAGWEADWIAAAEDITIAEFNHSYMAVPSDSDLGNTPPPTLKKTMVCEQLLDYETCLNAIL
jgi:hypothetical protein